MKDPASITITPTVPVATFYTLRRRYRDAGRAYGNIARSLKVKSTANIRMIAFITTFGQPADGAHTDPVPLLEVGGWTETYPITTLQYREPGEDIPVVIQLALMVAKLAFTMEKFLASARGSTGLSTTVSVAMGVQNEEGGGFVHVDKLLEKAGVDPPSACHGTMMAVSNDQLTYGSRVWADQDIQQGNTVLRCLKKYYKQDRQIMKF